MFGVAQEQVVGLIAAGESAFIKAVEGAEDTKGFTIEDLKAINSNTKGTIVGITASGLTPFVIGGLNTQLR